jgi:hypothetical protein
MSVDLLLAIAKSFSYPATIASLLSALLIGRYNLPGATWGPISSPGPSRG